MRDVDSEISRKERFLNSLSSFLVKNKNVLIIMLVVIVLSIITIGIVNAINDKKNNQAAMLIEEIQKEYDEWVQLEDDDETKTEKKGELLAKIDDNINNNNASFANKRLYFLKGQVFFSLEEWEEAAQFFKQSAAFLKESYLSPISLMLAASAYENNSEYQNALDIYTDVYSNYKDTYPDVPRAMLSIGRLNEQLEKNDEAIEAYNKLIDEYPSNPWTNFARTRIINLN